MKSQRRAQPVEGTPDGSDGSDGSVAAPASGRVGWRLVAGVAVVALQLLLAVMAFNPAPHTGGDNAGYISLAHSLLETGAYTDEYDPARLPHTKYPPVFPAVLALWILLGAKSWVALKTTAVVFTTLSVLFAFLWASERRGPLFGFGVAGLFALSSATVDAGHWILSEPPFLTFTLLALWAFERTRVREERALEAGSNAEGEGEAGRWTAALALLGGAAAVLAYFTRSAGLPLLVAVALWLAWRRRWRGLAAFAVGGGVPALLWVLRARSVGQGAYIGEFWMVDPYDPSLGRVGPLGLLGRFGENLVGYVTRHIPGGIVGSSGTWVLVLGVVLVALAVVGWARAVRPRPGVAELFVPLYLGLILLWPQVWSGDRFALPLFPLLFFYAGEALVDGAQRAGRAAVFAAVAVAVLVVSVPAFSSWTRTASMAKLCAASARASGSFGCYGMAVDEFVRLAMWSRTALPEGAAVFSRKPRIFYVMSGVRSRTFPFSPDPDVLLAEAAATGARYVLVDVWDALALHYVGEAISRRPEAFCVVGGFDPAEGTLGTLLLGIIPDAPADLDEQRREQLVLDPCPAEMLGDISAPIPVYSSSLIPLLASPPGR